MATSLPDDRLEAEWLEADRIGGIASATLADIRTRCYHALPLAGNVPSIGAWSW